MIRMCLFCSVFFFQVLRPYAYWGLLLMVALSSAGVLVMLGSMRADVCDSETVRVGKHREAV